MPRVPEYNLPSVAPQNNPGVRQDSPIDPKLAGIGARQTSALGEALQNAGNELGHEQIDAQEMANQVRLNDAKNQFLSQQNRLTYNADEKQGELGFQAYKGKDALTPDPNGQPLDSVFADKMRNYGATISQSLGNDAQRRAFNMYTNTATAEFQQGIQRHMLSESNTYTRETNKGTIDLALDTAALSYDNPDIVKQQVASAKAAAWHQSKHDGLDGAAQTMVIKDSESAIHRRVIEAALENNNPLYAMAYKDQNKSGMTAKDILSVMGRLNHQADAFAAQTITNNTAKYFSSQIAPSGLDTAFNVMLGMESGGKQFGKDGKPLTSPAGAIGIAQVMPTTAPEAAKIAGLQWDENRYRNDPEYNKALGKAYFAKQVETFGDVDKAMAAYNAGPGAVAKAIKKDPQNWLSLLPAETQDYVKKGTSKFNTGGAAVEFPTKLQFVDYAAKQLPDQSRPELVKMVRENAEHQYGLMEQVHKDDANQALHSVQKALIANGGNYSALPANLVATLAQKAPDRVDDAIKFAKVLSSKEEIVSDQTAMFNVINNFSTGNKNDIAKLPNSEWFQFKTVLSKKDFEYWSKKRADEINGVDGSSKNDPANVKTSDFRNTLTGRLASIGIDTKPKSSDKEGIARIGGIQQFAEEWVRNDQIASGKRFNQDETQKSLDRLFSSSVEFRNTFLGFNASTSSQKLISLQIKDVPTEAKDGIKAALIKSGNKNPSDQEVLSTYWRLHAKR